jgi:hypothetical protein
MPRSEKMNTCIQMFTGVKSQVEMKRGRAQTIANTSEQQFKVEFECEFLGSVDTLISPSKLRSLVYDHPKTQ